MGIRRTITKSLLSLLPAIVVASLVYITQAGAAGRTFVDENGKQCISVVRAYTKKLGYTDKYEHFVTFRNNCNNKIDVSVWDASEPRNHGSMVDVPPGGERTAASSLNNSPTFNYSWESVIP